jgi:hypothetical protein
MPNTDSHALQGYVSPFSQRGWRDALRGRPYPQQYDSWPEPDQRNYENGRLRAVGARTLWKRKDIPKAQDALVVKLVAANQRGFIPPSRDPDAPPEPLPPPPLPVY